MNQQVVSRISRVCRHADRSVVVVLTIIFLCLLGYGIGLFEVTGQVSGRNEYMILILLPVLSGVAGTVGFMIGQSNRRRGFVTGALVGLLGVSGFIAIGVLGMTDSLGKPLPSMLLPLAAALVVVGLLADISGIVLRYLPRKGVPAAS